MKKIILKDNYVEVINGNVIEKIPIDEKDASYIELKNATNNFTENMIQKNELEIIKETVDMLVLDSLGVL